MLAVGCGAEPLPPASTADDARPGPSSPGQQAGASASDSSSPPQTRSTIAESATTGALAAQCTDDGYRRYRVAAGAADGLCLADVCPRLPREWTACHEDADCVAVELREAECNGMGPVASVTREHEGALRAEWSSRATCPNVPCGGVCCFEAVRPACIDARCGLTSR